MPAASKSVADDEGSTGLNGPIQIYLGQLLGGTYAALSSDVRLVPPDISALVDRLTAALAASAVRDERLFRRELEALIPNLRCFAMSLARNDARADDLVQDTLLRAWGARGRFAMGTNLAAWLFTIMRNAFYSTARKNALEVGPDDDPGEGVATVPNQLDHLDVQDVQRALNGLREPMRQALVLVAVEGLSYEDAAVIMKCQIGTVKSRVWRGREQLVHLLGYDASELGADHVMLSAVNGHGVAARV